MHIDYQDYLDRKHDQLSSLLVIMQNEDNLKQVKAETMITLLDLCHEISEDIKECMEKMLSVAYIGKSEAENNAKAH